jgi:hypothetical protein
MLAQNFNRSTNVAMEHNGECMASKPRTKLPNLVQTLMAYLLYTVL